MTIQYTNPAITYQERTGLHGLRPEITVNDRRTAQPMFDKQSATHIPGKKPSRNNRRWQMPDKTWER